MAKRVLFLCTGNYYRSRFAEILFNELAHQKDLDWIADSRGLNLDTLPRDGSAISPFTVKGLAQRGITSATPARSPRALNENDLTQAQRVIALNQTEHHPYLRKQFPAWADRVEYWRVSDLDRASADQALAQIERQVHALIGQLTTKS